MSLQQQPLKRQPSAPAKPCDACGTLTRTGKHVPGIGLVGPTCYRKVAALQAVLEREGLTKLFTGRLEFEVIEGEDAHGNPTTLYPADVARLKFRAEQLGLKFERRIVHGTTAECWVELPRNKEARHQLLKRLERSQVAA